MTLCSVCVTSVAVGIGAFGINLDRSVKVGDRQVVFFLLIVPIGSAVIFRSTFRIERDRLCIIGDRLVEIPVEAVKLPPARICVMKRRAQLDRLRLVGHRLFVKLLAFVGPAPVVISPGKFWIELDGLGAI